MPDHLSREAPPGPPTGLRQCTLGTGPEFPGLGILQPGFAWGNYAPPLSLSIVTPTLLSPDGPHRTD